MTAHLSAFLIAHAPITNPHGHFFFNISLPVVLLIIIALVLLLIFYGIFLSPIGSRKNKAKKNTIF